MLWVPFLVGVAMCIAGLWMLLRTNDTLEKFDRDWMATRGHEKRIRDIEATVRQLIHSGEVPMLEDAGTIPHNWTQETILRD